MKYKDYFSNTATNEFEKKEVEISNDIYSLAYAACIHPNECQTDEIPEDEKGDYMPRIKLNNEERSSVFTSALMVTLI